MHVTAKLSKLLATSSYIYHRRNVVIYLYKSYCYIYWYLLVSITLDAITLREVRTKRCDKISSNLISRLELTQKRYHKGFDPIQVYFG